MQMGENVQECPVTESVYLRLESKSCKSFSISEKVSSTNKVTVAQHDLQFHTGMAAAQAET
ncbi:hypothetical protein A2U01_0058528, partial [Trifolium medium]|nr:hypothetical protein [Trifolium medium]